ncbi:MAG: hypothetical protein M3347_08775 [Armatimonadota bacterium]|nr:hypothetical protein [Armatimonadota bacterium]
MRVTTSVLIGGLFGIALLTGSPEPARTDCKLPPLNGVEQRQSNPVKVDGYTFTTGYYSYRVESYRIDSLHCTDSINIGPRHWWVIVGLGGDEPIGPRASSGAGRVEQRTAPAAPLPALPLLSPSAPTLPTLPGLAPVEQWKPLPALPQPSTSSLPPLPPLTP